MLREASKRMQHLGRVLRCKKVLARGLRSERRGGYSSAEITAWGNGTEWVFGRITHSFI